MGRVLQEFQSTFPQGERRYSQRHDPAVFEVSIHVPARGTTHYQWNLPGVSKVSIHVPARGTTFLKLFRAICTDCFNPRSRKGNDIPLFASQFIYLSFNPRSRKGNDVCALYIFHNKNSFNPRSRKGNDRCRIKNL